MNKRKQISRPAAQSEFPRKTVFVRKGETERDTARNLAATAIAPETAAARVVLAAEAGTALPFDIDLPSMIAELRQQAATVNGGDLSRAEAMLMNQATALQTMFMGLTERGLSQRMAQNLEMFLRLALRAQNQSRATLETLAAIKSPPIVYAKQANVTNGPQQVNNGVPAPEQRAQVLETESEQNKLLETPSNGEWMDTGATREAGRANSNLASVGVQHRTEDV